MQNNTEMIGTRFYKDNYDLDEYAAAADWCNTAQQAMIEDKGEYYEVVEIPPPTQAELNAVEIERLKGELASTDYKCLKYVDGALTDEEYAEVKAYRAELRARINKLEAQ